MSWHFLQEGVEASWLQSSLDGAPNALLKLMPAPDAYCSTGSEMELSPTSQFGTTSERLMDGLGADISMSLAGDSPAKTLANAVRAQASMASDPAYGWKWPASFVRYDPSAASSWRTRQCSLLGGLDEFSQTWPEWGWMRDGECCELPPLEQPITERGFTWLLTPTAQSWKAWTFRNPLALIRKNHADGNLQEQLMRLYQRMVTPRCQEILMMWPEGWTDSKPLGMDGFQQWQREHGGF